MTWQTMYPAQPGSPETTTVGAINTTDTSITVTDISCFLDATNLACLWDDLGHFEVVKYTNIAGSVLTVVRGFEGTAQSWGAGAYIANLIPAYAINSLQNNVNELNSLNGFTGDPSTLTLSQDNNGYERVFFKDDFGNDTSAQYTITGSVVIGAGVATLDTTEKIIKTLATTATTGKWDKIFQFSTTYSVDQSSKLYVGATSFLDVQRKTGNAIWLQLTINGVSLIAATDTTVTLADSTYGRAYVTYDGTNWQMYWNGIAVGAATAGNAPVTPSIGVLATASTIVYNELTFIPSVAFQDLFGSDTEARYAQAVSTDGTTWAAAAAGDVVVNAGVMTLSSDDDKYLNARLKSYKFGSGEYEVSLDNNSDGGGGADSMGLYFAMKDLSNYYKVVIEDDAAGAELLKVYKVVANTPTQLGSTSDVSATYTRGNKTWLKVHWDEKKGRIWVYIRDDTGVYPTTPHITDAFSNAFSYGYVAVATKVTTAGAGNLSVAFDDLTIRAKLLIGETNIPTTETLFYYKDEFGVDSIGRHTTTGTWAVGSGVLSCSAAGNCTFPFMASIGVHTFTPTLADGTDYYYFSGYRIKFVASGGNQCIVTLETAAGVAQGTGSLTVTTTSGAFANPIVITETATAITVTVTGATGTITSGATTSSGIAPYLVIGTATCSFDNYSFSGSRYYYKPMLRGAQIGEYWNGSAVVACTRHIDGFNWDTSGELTNKNGTFAIDTLNGHLAPATGSNFVCAYITGLEFGDGYYEVEMAQTTVSASFAIKITFCWDGNIGASPYYTNNSYVVTLSNNLLYYGKRVNGSASESSTAYTTTAGEFYRVGILKIGSSHYIYVNGILIVTYVDSTYTTGKVGIVTYGSTAGKYKFRNLFINALETTSKTDVMGSIGGVPHGARYDIAEYLVKSISNAARYGKYIYATGVKTVNSSAEDIEGYFKNVTDNTNVTDDASDTVAISLSDNSYLAVTKDITLNGDDIGDTITFQVRRKTAATDNTSPCFIDYLALLPVAEV